MKYKVDARVGCISVSVAGEKTSNGLHDDMDEVVAYWQGRRDKDNKWEVPQVYIDKANSLCNILNALTKERDTLKEALRYIANINAEYFTIHQEHNKRLFTLRDNIDAVLDGVRTIIAEATTSAAKDKGE